MISVNPIKMLMLFIMSILIFTETSYAQDSLKLSAQKQFNWLIKLAHLSTLQEVNDSLEIKGYRLTRENENGPNITIFYRNNTRRNLILINSDDGERIVSCTYFVDTKELFDQTIAAVKAIGFYSFKGFNASDGELAFAKQNNLIVFSLKKTKGEMQYLVITSKLNLQLP
jgi:hypothetical protein